MRKIKIYSELVYLLALVTLPFAVATMAAADFGVSVIVAPAYILSLRFTIFSFGQWNYILQGVLFIAFCIAVKRFKWVYLFSFITCVIYGIILDAWRLYVPILNPNITAVGSMNLPLRIIMFLSGLVITAFTVMLFFKSYIYPQVCDFFVKGLAQRYSLNSIKVKRIYDIFSLAIAATLTLLLFGGFEGIKWGTVIVALFTSVLVDFFSKIYDRFFETTHLFPNFENKFRF